MEKPKLKIVAPIIAVLAGSVAVARDLNPEQQLELDRAHTLVARINDLSDPGEPCEGADPGPPVPETLYASRYVVWVGMTTNKCVDMVLKDEEITERFPYPETEGFDCSAVFIPRGSMREDPITGHFRVDCKPVEEGDSTPSQ